MLTWLYTVTAYMWRGSYVFSLARPDEGVLCVREELVVGKSSDFEELTSAFSHTNIYRCDRYML